MSLADEYKRQLAWRDWKTALDSLPPPEGSRVLDLGCGVGDVAAMLADRGATIVGVDMNDELLVAARAQRIPRAEFRAVDLRALPHPRDLAGLVDGIWCSFAMAYFTDPAPLLRSWLGHARPGLRQRENRIPRLSLASGPPIPGPCSMLHWHKVTDVARHPSQWR